MKPQKSDSWRVKRIEEGDLAHYLAERIPQAGSVRAIRRLLDRGLCKVNGKVETFGSRRLKAGDIIETAPIALVPEKPKTADLDKRRIVLDKDNVLVYDKPPFLPVTPTESGKQRSLMEMLAESVGEIFPVHRLDAETSGLVLFARTKELAEQLTGLFHEHEVKKAYLALVSGKPRDTGDHRSYLICVQRQAGFERWATGQGAGARSAHTKWTLVERFRSIAALLRVEPLTGRHHQIRIHCSELGFPLLGDRMYGQREDPIACSRHMLHATRLSFTHPTTEEHLICQSKMPDDFETAMDQLRAL